MHNSRMCEINEALPKLGDEVALEVPELFPAWQMAMLYEKGIRLRYAGKLYRVEQTHTSQADWLPDLTHALYSEVHKPGQGDTPDNPIPYNGNMELFKDKYYAQDGVTYICTRDSGVPLYNALKDLVGLYVEVYVG